MVERRGTRGSTPGDGGGVGGSMDSLVNTPPDSAEMVEGTAAGLDLSLSQTMTRSLGSRGSLCDEDADDCDSINVVVRCRPLNEKELQRGEESVVTFPGEGQIWVNMDGMNGQVIQKPKMFTYNVVFEHESTQGDILEHSGITRLLDMALDGFSCTVFCYGQTGSGKTHTLTGPPYLFDKQPDMLSEDHGLIFRSFVYLFNQLENRPEQEFTIQASYLEIYNEKVIDLLNIGTNTKPLQVRWSKKKRGFFVENLFSIECAELDDLLAVLEEGLRNRAIASHNMNEYSSRSHTILTVTINSEQKADDGVFITKSGKVNFVDLAGSEMTKKTLSEGKTLEEANNINKSLMVLGTCISALSDSRKRDGHIPYRDSKLTKLLADSLAGNGVTLMIACVSPARSNISETVNTLRYAGRAKRIRTKPIIIMEPKEKLIMNLRKDVTLLQEENQHLRLLLDLAAKNGEIPMGEDGNPLVVPPGSTTLLALSGNPPNKNGTRRSGATTPLNLKGLSSGPGLSRQPSFRLDKDKLDQLEPGELVGLVQHYMEAHDTARKEIKELEELSTLLVRDQELVSKENERLLKKLEDINSNRNNVYRRQSGTNGGAGSHSYDFMNGTLNLAGAELEDLEASIGSYRKTSNRRPTPHRPSIHEYTVVTTPSQQPSSLERRNSRTSPQNPQADLWVNPKNSANGNRNNRQRESDSRQDSRMPDSINKELEKRRIGKSLNDLTVTSASSRGSGSSRGSQFGLRASKEMSRRGGSGGEKPVKSNPPSRIGGSKPPSPGDERRRRIQKARSQSVPRQAGRDTSRGNGPPKPGRGGVTDRGRPSRKK